LFFQKPITKIFLGFFFFLLVLGSANLTSAQASQTPEQVAAEFYKWYLSELNRDRDPRTQAKQKVLKYLSRRAGKWLYSIPPGEYGADYFIDAQDFDEEWAETVSVSKATIKGNTASLTVTLGVYKDGRKYQGIGKHVLRLKMVREGGLWKIDRINNM
jgi:hypothetical protein